MTAQARQLPRSDYLKLKAAFRGLVERVGSDAHASRQTRVSSQHIGRYGNVKDPDCEDTFAPIDVIADLESEAGPIVTRQLAELCNHVLVELPPGARDVMDLGRVTGRAMKEVGDVFAAMGRALDDGILGSVEGPGLLKEIDEAIVMMATLRLMVIERTRPAEC